LNHQDRISQQDVETALRRAGLETGASVYFHSRLIGRLESGADTIIDALINVVGQDGTIVMPTFTWELIPAVANPPILQENAKIWTGMLPKRFLEYSGVKRDRHPLWSNAYLGPLADELIEWNEQELFGYAEDKVAYRLSEVGGSAFMFACSFKSCSSMYVVHDQLGLPYRQPLKKRRGHSVDDYLSWTPERQRDLIDFDGDYRSGAYDLPDFSLIEDPLRDAGVLQESPLGKYQLLHVTLHDLFSVMREEHMKRPELLFRDAQTPIPPET